MAVAVSPRCCLHCSVLAPPLCLLLSLACSVRASLLSPSGVLAFRVPFRMPSERVETIVMCAVLVGGFFLFVLPPTMHGAVSHAGAYAVGQQMARFGDHLAHTVQAAVDRSPPEPNRVFVYEIALTWLSDEQKADRGIQVALHLARHCSRGDDLRALVNGTALVTGLATVSLFAVANTFAASSTSCGGRLYSVVLTCVALPFPSTWLHALLRLLSTDLPTVPLYRHAVIWLSVGVFAGVHQVVHEALTETVRPVQLVLDSIGEKIDRAREEFESAHGKVDPADREKNLASPVFSVDAHADQGIDQTKARDMRDA